jgi:hypothetical protein
MSRKCAHFFTHFWKDYEPTLNDQETSCAKLEVIGGGLVWDPLCDDFAPLNDYFCPAEGFVEEICSAKFPLENPAVKKNWCRPFFGARLKMKSAVKT